jgi:hypothetical protein
MLRMPLNGCGKSIVPRSGDRLSGPWLVRSKRLIISQNTTIRRSVTSLADRVQSPGRRVVLLVGVVAKRLVSTFVNPTQGRVVELKANSVASEPFPFGRRSVLDDEPLGLEEQQSTPKVRAEEGTR